MTILQNEGGETNNVDQNDHRPRLYLPVVWRIPRDVHRSRRNDCAVKPLISL